MDNAVVIAHQKTFIGIQHTYIHIHSTMHTKDYTKKFTFVTFWHAPWPSPHCSTAPASPSVDSVTVQQMQTEFAMLPELLQPPDYNNEMEYNTAVCILCTCIYQLN